MKELREKIVLILHRVHPVDDDDPYDYGVKIGKIEALTKVLHLIDNMEGEV